MPQLTLHLLGGCRLHDALGNEIRIASRKARALLCFLALRPGEPHSRDRLATLLWEDTDEELARSSLRQALAALRKGLPESSQAALKADADTVRIDPELIDSDAAALRRGLPSGNRTALQAAIALHRGELLEGFDAKSSAFDEWLSTERLTLRRQLSDALQTLTRLCSTSDDTQGALEACTRLVALEPLNEAAHRTLMELHARRNAYAEGLRQYRLCKEVLRRELDVAPEPATEALYRDLMRRRRAASVDSDTEPVADKEESTPEPTQQPAARAGLRDAAIFVVRYEGLLELEATLDPEEAMLISNEFHARVQRAVKEFGGIADRRVGSNVLAAFGLRTARGNEADCAAQAALLLRDVIGCEPWPVRSKVSLRMGLAHGQVLLSPEVFPLTGRPTHIAHTLAASAVDGQILVAEEARRALSARMQTELTALSATSAAPAWSLLGTRSESSVDDRPFIGRRAELAMILAVMERCASSRNGRAIVIRGEAGIGKTRLVDALRSAARERGLATHNAQVFDFGQSPSHRPITLLALSLAGVAAHAPVSERSAAVKRMAAETGAGVDQMIFLSDLIDAPLDREVSALKQAMDVATRQRGRSLMLAQLIETEAQRKPLLLVVEDVHWTDSDELARLGEIAAVVARSSILFIVTTRPEGDPINAAWRARARGCPVTTVDLAPLAEDEAQQFAAHYRELPAGVIADCIRRAEGHPLFLEQLFRAADAGHESLPGSVRSLVLARVDRLASGDHQALEAAAVLGLRCGIDAVQHLLDNDDCKTTPLLDTGLVRHDGLDLEFAHALFRDAIYESTLKSRRRELHRRAAAWFRDKDRTLYADHLAAAEDEHAAQAYMDAARAEQSALHFERALALINKSYALAREPQLLHHISCVLGELLLQLGRTHDALTAYREALDFAVDPPDQGNAWFGIASALRIMDRHEEALDALGHAETALAATADAQTRARLYTLRGNLSFPLGHFDACLRAHEQARVFASQANSPIDIARALGGLGDAYYQRGKMLTARDHFVQCATQARTHGMVSVLLANLPMVGITNIYCGAIEAANESLEEAFELSRRIGDLRSELLVHLCLSTGLMMQARLDECVTRARRALELAIQLGARRFQAETLGVLANALYSQGEQLGALRLAEEGLQLGRETGMSYCGPALLSVLARVTGNDEQRAQALSEAEALLANGCVSHSYFEFYSNAIEVSLVKQRWDEARRYAQALEMYTSEEPLPWTQLLIRRGIALADVGEGRPCVETLMQLREECLRMKTLHLLGGIEEGMAIGCRL